MVDTNKLKGRMVEMGFTQRTLAHRIGINKNTLNAKLNGKSNFDTGEIILICDALGIQSPEEKCAIFLNLSSHKRDERN